MSELMIAGFKFLNLPGVYYVKVKNTDFEYRELFILKTIRGKELALLIDPPRKADLPDGNRFIKKVLSRVNKNDLEKLQKNTEMAKKAFNVCREKITHLNLKMKLTAAEYIFDRSRLIFYFTAQSKIDFRELVKILASIFKTRIELRQIGSRDETRLKNGVGVCGRELCCSKFCPEFSAISISMAKDQRLPLHPIKISGACGKLKCCLKYEENFYKHMKKIIPPIGTIVESPEGQGVIIDYNCLDKTVSVELEKEKDNNETVSVRRVFDLKFIKIIKIAESDNIEYDQDLTEEDIKQMRLINKTSGFTPKSMNYHEIGNPKNTKVGEETPPDFIKKIENPPDLNEFKCKCKNEKTLLKHCNNIPAKASCLEKFDINVTNSENYTKEYFKKLLENDEKEFFSQFKKTISLGKGNNN